MLTIRKALVEATRRLREAGIGSARQEASWLLAHALGITPGELHLQAERTVPAGADTAFTALVDQRACRVPLQYLLGTQEFLGLSFTVTPAVLIPRPDTEVLVQSLAQRLPAAFPHHRDLRVADIGTGSGCVAVGLCHLLPAVQVVAVDLSAEALAVAAANASRLGTSARVAFRHGDLYGPLAGEQFHAIASNPPYIPAAEMDTLEPEVRLHEPQAALTPGGDGLAVICRLIAGAREHLFPGGLLALEVGRGQAAVVMELLQEQGFRVEAFQDSLGHLRCVHGAYW